MKYIITIIFPITNPITLKTIPSVKLILAEFDAITTEKEFIVENICPMITPINREEPAKAPSIPFSKILVLKLDKMIIFLQTYHI